ncbi:MAG: hypothetical protein Q7R94_01085 [bacterium]|nr:hypothetical protein [bacterium]
MPHSTFYILHSRRAQAILALILLIGGIILLIALALAFLATSFVNSAYGYAIAQRAQAVAISGANDALMQLARDKDFSSGGYSFSVGSSTATVTVTQNSPLTGQVAITSTATITFRKRTVGIVVSRNASSSQITVISWTQI